MEVIRDYLIGQGGEAPARDVLGAARAAGIPERTAQRARKRARVVTRKGGMGGPWVWSLTDGDSQGATEDAEAAEPQDVAPTAPSWRLGDDGDDQ